MLIYLPAVLLIIVGVLFARRAGMRTALGRTWLVAGIITSGESIPALMYLSYPSVVRKLFEQPAHNAVWGWLGAAVVTSAFIVLSARSLEIPRQELWGLNALKIYCVVLALVAALFEEIFFRYTLMDLLQMRGIGALLQILVSALAFGLLHAVWALLNRKALFGALMWTAGLGVGLATTYVVGGRFLLPCVVAHFVIDAVLEPGLIHSFVAARLRRLQPSN